MLNKLINNLKQNLPEPIRKKLGIEDENAVESSSDYSEESDQDSHDTSDKDASAEDKKKKKISMIIRVIVVIGLGYMAVTEFILKDDNQNSEVATIATKPRKPRKKPIAIEAKTEKVEENKIAEETPPVVPVTPVAPVEEVVVAPKEETPPVVPVAPVAPVEEASLLLRRKKFRLVAPVENINIAEKKDEDVPAPITPVGEVKASESTVDQSIDKLIDKVDTTAKDPAEVGETTVKKEINLADKIAKDDVYTPPPAYDQIGRGLVYNCKEKYWACIDKSAYVACNKNMKWNNEHGKQSECVVQNVYNSDDDCGVIQKYNISTSKETTFCK